MKSDRLQGLDVRGDNVTFGDDNINFDLQLEKFGVDMEALKHVPIRRVFRAWVEDWEEERRGREMTPSVRPSCLQSIKVLSFVILIITTVHLKCGMKIWNTVRDEVVDGL